VLLEFPVGHDELALLSNCLFIRFLFLLQLARRISEHTTFVDGVDEDVIQLVKPSIFVAGHGRQLGVARVYLAGNSTVYFRVDVVVPSHLLIYHLILLVQVTFAPHFVGVEVKGKGACLWLPHLHILIVYLDRQRE